MKAVQARNYGGPEVVEVNDISVPVPKEGQVQVDVYSASLNPFDLTLLSGVLKDKTNLTLPFTLGGDFAGVISQVGEKVEDYKIGNEVYGTANVMGGGSGSFAQITSANTGNISHKPKKVSFDEAAALPLVGSSAVQAIIDHIKLQNNTKILIHGGAGGIGHIAIQIASNVVGAHVSTTVSTEDIDFVKSLGANGVIDYKNQDFEGLIKEYDAIFDTVGGEVTNKSLNCLRRGGILVTMIGEPDQDKASELGVTAIRQGTKNNTEHLSKLAEFVDAGKIKVNIDKVFPLDEAVKAVEYKKASHPKGKIVIKVR